MELFFVICGELLSVVLYSIALIFSWYMIFSSISYPCASRKYIIHNNWGSILSAPISSFSVDLVVFNVFLACLWWNLTRSYPSSWYRTCAHAYHGVWRMMRIPTTWVCSWCPPTVLSAVWLVPFRIPISVITFYICPLQGSALVLI